jgi:hypothetical protein
MRILTPLFLLLCVGCSTSLPDKGAPVSVSGKVTQSGKPVGDIVVTFQPLGDGHLSGATVNEDGSFKADIVPGKYAYFVGKSTLKTSEQALKKIDSKYLEANMQRTVSVQAGQELAISLD